MDSGSEGNKFDDTGHGCILLMLVTMEKRIQKYMRRFQNWLNLWPTIWQ